MYCVMVSFKSFIKIATMYTTCKFLLHDRQCALPCRDFALTWDSKDAYDVTLLTFCTELISSSIYAKNMAVLISKVTTGRVSLVAKPSNIYGIYLR